MGYSTRTGAHLLFGICFLCLLVYMAAGLDISKDTSRENRPLTSFPDLRVNSKTNRLFAAQLERFIADHLSLRDKMIDMHGKILSVFDHRGNKHVSVGRDGWLFSIGNGNSHNFSQLLYYQRKVRFTNAQLTKIKADLIAVRDWAAQNNMLFYVMFPPDKQTVYKEYFPSYVKTMDRPTLVQSVEEAIQADINVVSLEKPFRYRRQDDYLHYKTESHWSPAGAYLAYQLLMKRIGRDIKELHPLNENDMVMEKTADVLSCLNQNGRNRIYKGNQFEMLLRPSYLNVEEPIYTKYTLKNQDKVDISYQQAIETSYNPNGQKYTVYMITDSYADFMFPFMAGTFQKVYKSRINQGKWGIRFESRKEEIKNAKPDILIFAISDLKLIELLKIMN